MINTFYIVKKYWLTHPVYADIQGLFFISYFHPVLLYFKTFNEYPHQTYFRLFENDNSEINYEFKSAIYIDKVKERLRPFIEKSRFEEQKYRDLKFKMKHNIPLKEKKYTQLSLFEPKPETQPQKL